MSRQMSTFLKSISSINGPTEGMLGYSCGDNHLHTATYRNAVVSLLRIEGQSLVLTRKHLVDINLVINY